ncbi:hypothetical protein GH714_028101 [Hevea brasiliensis]|uniref:Pentacotripeptide-repeat region of PRORP domain-containing protein n=1 Tax=Hevea brasiliensis TaxID=3981 RepID=A0A6A6MJ26_HEVBR|nr:hypothetical protein GH714_028101 [Hevea brasiliensis]
MRFYEDMKTRGICPDVVTYNTMINGYYKFRKMEEAEKLFVEMKGKNIAPTVISYTTMIKGGKRDLKEMVGRHLAPKDNSIFISLLSSQCKAGDLRAAEDVLKAMIRLSIPTEAGHYGVLIEIFVGLGNAYMLLIESYLRKGEPAEAKTALDAMIEEGHVPDSSVFRSVMESLFEDGRVQTASRVMKGMVEKGVKENMDLVAKILEALLMRGHVEEALGRIELLMHSGCHVNFDDLLSVLSEKGKTIAAVKLLDFASERDFNVEFKSCDKVLDALLAAGKTLNAYSILCKIMEKGGVTDWSSCEDLIKSLNQEGNTKQADILSRMIKGWEKSRKSKKGKKQSSLAF